MGRPRVRHLVGVARLELFLRSGFAEFALDARLGTTLRTQVESSAEPIVRFLQVAFERMSSR